MADRLVVGDATRLGNTFTVSGVNTDPTTVTLVVTDPSGNVEGTYTYAGGTVNRSAAGVYYRDVTVDEDGVWGFKWTGTGTAADISAGSFTVWPATVDTIDVLTVVEAKQALGINQTNTDNDDYIRALVTAVSAQLDQLCGPVRTRTVTDETHDGGNHTIQLRKRPVYSITTITEYDGTTATTLTAETNALKPAAGYIHDGTVATIHSGLIRRRDTDTDIWFQPGRRNIAATYVAGRAATTEVVPAKFKQAAAMMLRNVWVGEMASGTETFGAFAVQEINPLLGPGMLNKVAALLTGEMIDGVMIG